MSYVLNRALIDVFYDLIRLSETIFVGVHSLDCVQIFVVCKDILVLDFDHV